MSGLRTRCSLICLVVFVINSSGSVAVARDIHVNNVYGSDRFDGASTEPVDTHVGPVKSLRRAIALCRQGDRILLANTGEPYYDSISLVGTRRSGFDGFPLIVDGQGSTISGAQQVAFSSWRNLGADIWKLNPERKQFFQLLRNGRIVSEWQPDESGFSGLPEGHWCAWKGAIYYRTFRGELLQDATYAIARQQVGLTLYGVKHVLVRDVKFQHFRLDGINAHDRCEDVVLENVTVLENGRAGIAVGGVSSVEIVASQLLGNRIHSLLVAEEAEVNVVDCQLSQPATVDGVPATEP